VISCYRVDLPRQRRQFPPPPKLSIATSFYKDMRSTTYSIAFSSALVYDGVVSSELSTESSFNFMSERDAVNADYRQISEKGNSLKQMLENSENVRITSAKGTDLTFSLAGRSAIVDAGIVAKLRT